MVDESIGPGKRVGRFLLLERIGSGGMGVVYRARDEKLRRDVAIKVLTGASSDDPRASARLIREARLASSLNHPGISTIHEVVEEGERVFIVMELVEGRSLSESLPPGGLPVSTVLRLGSQLAEALAYAHQHHVIHRDLKSANVMILPDGRSKILDFGLAKQMVSEGSETLGMSAATETGAVVGTAAYLSPEVMHGKEADARSDLWALGVILHESVCGTQPFQGRTSFELSANILNGEPAALPRTVPPGLRAVVARCLEKEPGSRYQEAVEVRAALEALRAAPSSGAESPPFRPAWREARPVVLGAGAAVAVAAMAAVLLFGQYRGCAGASTAIRSLAVLPLANLSGDPQQDYFADGMTDELISAFTHIGGLHVISRSSVMEYKLHPKAAKVIARELGVQALLEGTVRRFAGRVKITLDLVRGTTERNLWSESYERDTQDVLALQSEIAQKVADEIRIKLTDGERKLLRQSHRVNPQAHEHYLLARQRLYAGAVSRAEVMRALNEFDVALRLDSTYADAHAGKAEAYFLLSNYFMSPDSAYSLARLEVLQALRLNANLADAHSTLGMVYAGYDWDWPKAERELRRAIELNPGADGAHLSYGYWLVPRGRFAEAQRELDLSVELNPLSEFANWMSAWPSFYEGRYEETIRRLREQIRDDSTRWMPFSLLGETFEQQGHFGEAIDALSRSRMLGGNAWVDAALARVYAKAGLRDSARALLHALGVRSQTEFVTPYGRATAYMALGDMARAFALMDLAVRQRNEDLTLLEVDPRIGPLRKDPRFAGLIERVGFWR